MLILRNEKIYDDEEPLQEQLPLQIEEAQEEFDFAESNPELLDKLAALHEESAWKSVVVE